MRQVVVDDDAAALADLEAAVAGQVVAGPDAGGEHDEVDVEVVGSSPAKVSAATPAAVVGDDLAGGVARRGRRRRAPRCGARSVAAAAVVELHRHEAGGELDDVGLEAEAAQGVGRLEAEQAAADDRAAGTSSRPAARLRWPRGRRWCGRRSEPGQSSPGIGGTNGYEPVASTSAS